MADDDIKARLYSELNKLSPIHRNAAETLVRAMLKIIEGREGEIGNAKTELQSRIADLESRLLRIKNLSSLPNQ